MSRNYVPGDPTPGPSPIAWMAVLLVVVIIVGAMFGGKP